MEKEMQELQKDYSSLFNSLGNNCKQLEKYKNRIEILKNKEERDILIKYEYKVKGFNIIYCKKDKNPYKPDPEAMAIALCEAQEKYARRIANRNANRDCIITADLKKYGYKQGNKVDFAASNNRLDWIKQLIELGYEGTEDAIEGAVKNGHLEIVKYLHEKEYECKQLYPINKAAVNGHLEVIKYLHELGYKGDGFAIEGAAKNGHLEVVKYLHEKGYKCSNLAIIDAAGNGHLEVVKYLYEKGYKCSHRTIDCVANNGHLEVLKYLHELGYKCDKWAINNAAGNGHLEVVKYLHELGYKGTKDAINYVEYYGRTEVIEYLRSVGYS
nr:protein fem-1 homolog C-like [Hydra vulgaris]